MKYKILQYMSIYFNQINYLSFIDIYY